ncbi:MAG: hypothetical protein M1405_03515 [Patescibacteria group bacterium]|nr:hypothetical protein [Patescibacteria group bacterium]
MNKKIFTLIFLLVLVVILGIIAYNPRGFLKLLSGAGIYLSLQDKLMAQQNNIPTQTGKNLFQIQSEKLTKKVDDELVDLDNQIISCDSNVDSLLSSAPSIGGSCTGPAVNLDSVKGRFLGGQCCGVLKDTKEYHEQLEKLKQYSNIPDIPANPYKTPIELAKKWIDYDKGTNLNSNEQQVYDRAVSMSKEGGPCCCKCWHYYVNEGIAKKLIKNYGFNSSQIAQFWDVSDICGS